MSDQNTPSEVQGVEIHSYGSNDWKPGYEESDVRDLWRHAQPKSWQDLLHFDEQHGDKVWHITPGQAISMKEDIEAAMKSGAPFPDNPDQAYQEMHKHRGADRGKEPPAEKEMERKTR